MWSLVAGAGLAGLMGSPHCVGMCGPFAGAASTKVGDAIGWHTGRLLTYLALGAAAGGVGSVLSVWGAAATIVATALSVGFAAVLAGLIRPPEPRIGGLASMAVRAARRTGPAGRLVFGMATGLLPCGLVYAALALAVGARGPAWGAVAMGAFWLGTVPLLAGAAAGVQGWAARRPARRRLLAGVVLLASLASIAARHDRGPPSETGELPACH